MDFDPDALIAAVDLVGRSGGTQFEIGHDEDTGLFWAKAIHKGHLVAVEKYPRPDAAAMALCNRILDGAMCRYCQKQIVLGEDAPDTCRWKRNGERYEPGCGGKPPSVARNRAQRRAEDRATRKKGKKR